MPADDQSKQAYDEAMALLSDAEGNLTPHHNAYLKYEAEYKAKVREFNSAYQEAKSSPLKLHSWPVIGKEYSDAVNEAMNRWVVLGFKNEIEAALSLLKAQGSAAENKDTTDEA